jgi:hypothetical protein
MKLHAPFLQLPVLFDADALAREVASIEREHWREHPQKYPGNHALPLISVGGDPGCDGLAGAMQPTPFLERCPYLKHVLFSLGAVWGRTRLMRLAGQSEVTRHFDRNYYWRERMRVHVPVVTQPSVRFTCGDAEVNMAPGECWIFDTWRMHQVLNPADDERIHLVADTVGSSAFWDLMGRGRVTPDASGNALWQPEKITPPIGAVTHELRYESINVPTIMTPWELREHLWFLLADARPHVQLDRLWAEARRFLAEWQAIWAQCGPHLDARPAYHASLLGFAQFMERHACDVQLDNGGRFMPALQGIVLEAALAEPAR